VLQRRPLDISVSVLALLSSLAFGCANGGRDTAPGFSHDAGNPVLVDASDDGSGWGVPEAAFGGQNEASQPGPDAASEAADYCQQTCGGCCSGATCLLLWQESDTECGVYGAACQDCTLGGLTCNAGACQSASTGTGAGGSTGGGTGAGDCSSSCGGCCDSSGTCQSGTSQSACGDGTPGDPCQDCWPLVCDPNFGGCFLF
jgi:hypothetical protein